MSGERKGHLLRKLQHEMGSMTAARTNDMCLENVEQNEPYFRKGQTLKDLHDLGLGDDFVDPGGPIAIAVKEIRRGLEDPRARFRLFRMRH